MAIIKVENLSKKYIIGHDRNAGGAFKYQSLRESLSHSARGIYQRLRHPLSPNIENTELEEFWALKDINFEIKQGERVGIIGRNGAGKSTLLKILSRITEPTTGKITLKGRVASLLEVGTGFHPELTGRENIYLNGAVLGMSRQEIKKKFDEIVDFSGVEKFLDTPVKRYSSGMYVRLAFSVAAHLEPEILLVDEVLAVGDAEFQKKCLGKMEDVSKEGRTVLFVSHNMNAITSFTCRSILVEDGEVIKNDDTSDVVRFYLSRKNKNSTYVFNLDKTTPYFKEISVKTTYKGNVHYFGKQLSFKFRIYSQKKIISPAISYQIVNSMGIPILHILNLNEEVEFCQKPGITELKSIIPRCNLYPDDYTITAYLADKSSNVCFEKLENICHFQVKVFSSAKDYYWKPRSAAYVENSIWIKENE